MLPANASPFGHPQLYDLFDTVDDAAELAECIDNNENITKLNIAATNVGSPDEVVNVFLDELSGATNLTTLEIAFEADELSILELCFDYLPSVTTLICAVPLSADLLEQVGELLSNRAFNSQAHTRIRNLQVPLSELGFLALLRGWDNGGITLGATKYMRFPEEFIVTDFYADTDIAAFTELGWPILERFLTYHDNCPLTLLHIDADTDHHNDAEESMLNVLDKNHTLTHLNLPTVAFGPTFVDRLLTILGKSDDMMVTYKANHTIQQIQLIEDHRIHLNAEIEMLLRWNATTDEHYYARCRKMLEYHFGTRLDVAVLTDMTPAMLCKAGSLFDRAISSGVDEALVNRNKQHFYYEVMKNNILKLG